MTDFIWSIFVVSHLVLALIAVISMSKVASSMTALRAGRWIVLIVLLPIIGSVLWLWAGKRRVLRERAEDSTTSTQ
ncbi:hypothetical protein G7066_07220 [Leucobacter coleopterorum]|uniref:Cardiolipin synthase N-terminal domain-containing protein n=1 Tax=Leucobacter coleopterorum TaxID=2714933 RepID=A0ABX6K0A4_9MICO|nr:PLDc N-terminal domain-containing protein [Leucobacter coleopterorum]QIM18470.1 hypothetical protein G7066_07220 [Leucobacter coleopterorum]